MHFLKEVVHFNQFFNILSKHLFKIISQGFSYFDVGPLISDCKVKISTPLVCVLLRLSLQLHFLLGSDSQA